MQIKTQGSLLGPKEANRLPVSSNVLIKLHTEKIERNRLPSLNLEYSLPFKQSDQLSQLQSSLPKQLHRCFIQVESSFPSVHGHQLINFSSISDF